ncbi:probable indole-3-pyruvate monooxygenase YUCCA10 [Pistacia vera]|uniref:probable indole-3-pyruvate monooxygenase YUCCA10 n=1 Tax=Pistacia vera TaxID=55513 RepID=UPI001263073C|nr:probable indole-3-pyruvate monooxygenase YUCCA10 [Pistacia vera]
MQEQSVIIVGSGPSGLATAACLNQLSIPYMILEREDCYASLWKKYAYDRLHLHLAKQFCQLPHLPFPASYPNFIPKNLFLQYLDDYVSHFNIRPLYKRSVDFATYSQESQKWTVKARNTVSGEIEEYSGRFLVVASGETTDPFTPNIEGMDTFTGEVVHSTSYKNGKAYGDKSVLVVGSGNSGMEIALDLANHGAKTSIVVRSPVHVLTREMVYLGLVMLKYIPYGVVDSIMVLLSKLVYGDLSKYGINRPKEGPFFMKVAYGKYPVFDIGTCKKIKSGEIQVLPAIENIRGNEVIFQNGKSHPFDTIVLCTGFKRSTNTWLKGDEHLLNDDGLPKPNFPNHWKGKNGLFCVGLSRRGLYGASADAQNIANEIKSLL